MAPTEGRFARPERRWGCRRGTRCQSGHELYAQHEWFIVKRRSKRALITSVKLNRFNYRCTILTVMYAEVTKSVNTSLLSRLDHRVLCTLHYNLLRSSRHHAMLLAPAQL